MFNQLLYITWANGSTFRKPSDDNCIVNGSTILYFKNRSSNIQGWSWLVCQIVDLYEQDIKLHSYRKSGLPAGGGQQVPEVLRLLGVRQVLLEADHHPGVGPGLRSEAPSKTDPASHLLRPPMRSFYQWSSVGQVGASKVRLTRWLLSSV